MRDIKVKSFDLKRTLSKIHLYISYISIRLNMVDISQSFLLNKLTIFLVKLQTLIFNVTCPLTLSKGMSISEGSQSLIHIASQHIRG
jgi:hypothetical protein